MESNIKYLMSQQKNTRILKIYRGNKRWRVVQIRRLKENMEEEGYNSTKNRKGIIEGNTRQQNINVVCTISIYLCWEKRLQEILVRNSKNGNLHVIKILKVFTY